MHAHTWEDPEVYQIRTVNYANQNDWPKENQEKYPVKVIETAMRVWLWLFFSPWVCPCAYLPLLYLLSLNTYFTTFRLCGNSFLQSRGPGPFSLTTGVVARIWCFHHHDPAQFLAEKTSPHPSCCRLEPPEIKTTTMRSTHKTATREKFTQQQRLSTAKNKQVNKITLKKIIAGILLDV